MLGMHEAGAGKRIGMCGSGQIREEGLAERAMAGFVAGDHACCTFGSDASRDGIVTRVARDSLAGDERLLYLTEGPDEDAILTRVAAAGIDAAGWRASGRLEIQSATSLYDAGGFDPERQIAAFDAEKRRARADGYNGLAVTAEMGWMLSNQDDWDAILGYEREVTRIFDGGLRGLCMYDRREFPGELMARALLSHNFEVGVDAMSVSARHWGMRITEQGDPSTIRLFGEIDYASGHYLTARLADHIGGDGDVVIDARELSFLGASGCRALVDVANLLEPPRRLVLAGVSHRVMRVVHLCGFADHPQFRVEA